MEDLIKSAISEKSNQLFGFDCPDSLIQFQKTKKEFEGDTTLVLFPLMKLAGKAPQEIGKVLGDFLRDDIRCISDYSIIGGFLNVSFPNSYWTQQLDEVNSNADYGLAEKNSKPEIMVEYSSPNTNKPLHLGHLRNNFLGYSVAQILAAYGHRVVKTQIINDRGIHICKSMLAWQKFSPLNEKGERENPENTGMKGDKLVGFMLGYKAGGLDVALGYQDEKTKTKYTTLAGAKAVCVGLSHVDDFDVYSVQQLHAELKG